MRMRILFYMALLCPLFSEAVAKENGSPKVTEVRMMMQDGGMKQEIQYRYTKEQLRIDRVGKIIPSPPINLIDLKTKMLRIIHPHNGTWEEGALEQKVKKANGFPEMPNLPPGIGPKATPPRPVPTHGLPPAPVAPPKGFPKMPNVPAMPEGIPTNRPAGIGPGAAPKSVPGIPTMPAGMPAAGGMMPQGMPAFPMPSMMQIQKPLKLIALNQTNTVCGVVCQQYKLELPRMGSLTLWLSDDPSLPPFYPLRYNVPDRRIHSEWNEKVGELLRKEKKFPLLLELRGSGKDLLVQWKVLSIKPNQKQKDPQLFNVPKGLYKTEHF